MGEEGVNGRLSAALENNDSLAVFASLQPTPSGPGFVHRRVQCMLATASRMLMLSQLLECMRMCAAQ